MANNEICDCKTVIKELSSLDLLKSMDIRVLYYRHSLLVS